MSKHNMRWTGRRHLARGAYALGTMALATGLISLSPASADDQDLTETSQNEQLATVTEFHANGQLMSLIEQKVLPDGSSINHGISETYHENGKIAERQYFEDGQSVGTYETFFENGQMQLSYTLDGGTPHGIMRTWHASGQLATELTMNHGQAEGEVLAWFEDGTPESEGEYDQGKPVGLWLHQTLDGELASEDHGDAE